MIKTTRKGFGIEGSIPEVLCDLTQIIASVKKAFEKNDIPTEEIKKDIQQCVDLAFMTEEELKRKAKESLREMFQKLADGIFVEDKEEESNE